MTNLPTENEVTGKAKDILTEIKEAFGMVPNFFKAQAAADPDWLELNWNREKEIMLSPGGLDRKIRELIALAVTLASSSEYCSLAHETMALMVGATEQEVTQTKKIVELFVSFSSIVASLHIPCDITPDMAKKTESSD